MKRSKYKYDISLFKAEPPDNPRLIKDLFCGRGQELRRGVQVLKENMDINGRRFGKREKKPWVIHGESRSGKSHLARRIMAALHKSRKRIQITIPARERLEAQRVMGNIFEALRDEFETRINAVGHRALVEENPWLPLARQLIEQVSYFFRGAEAVTLKFDRSYSNGLEAGLNLSLVPKVVEVYAKLQGQTGSGESEEIRLRPPSPRDLAEYASVMIDTLLRLRLLSHALILVDDVDLLEGYVDPQRNARIQRSILSEALDRLHATRGIDVVLTARSWYAHNRKDFDTLVDLQDRRLDVSDLVQIHDKRFEVYGPKNLPTAFLTRQALREAAMDVDGSPGVFLRHLDTAFERFRDEPEWGERDYDWYLGIFRQIYESCRTKMPYAAGVIEDAVGAGQLHIDVKKGNPFHDTIFHDLFVFQSYYGEAIYYTDRLVRRIVSAIRTAESVRE